MLRGCARIGEGGDALATARSGATSQDVVLALRILNQHLKQIVNRPQETDYEKTSILASTGSVGHAPGGPDTGLGGQ